MHPLPESFVSLLREVLLREDCPPELRAGIAEYLASGDDSGLGLHGMQKRGFAIDTYASLGRWGTFTGLLYNWSPGTSPASHRVTSIDEAQVIKLRRELPPLPTTPNAP